MRTSFGKFVAIEATAVAAFNACINAAYTWWLWHPLDPLTLFGANAIGGDLASTPVFIGLLSTLLGTAGLRRRLGSGRVLLPADVGVHPMFGMLPRNIAGRAVVIAALCGLLFGAPLWFSIASGGDGVLTLAHACLVKVIITVPLSMVIVPFVAVCALADVQEAEAGQARFQQVQPE